MGDLIDLDGFRHPRTPAEALARAQVRDPDPDPVEQGWVVVERDPSGRPVRWFHPGLIAQVGQVPNAPDWVFLDHDDRIRAWSNLGPGDVTTRLRSGNLPEPEVTLRWDGSVVESG